MFPSEVGRDPKQTVDCKCAATHEWQCCFKPAGFVRIKGLESSPHHLKVWPYVVAVFCAFAVAKWPKQSVIAGLSMTLQNHWVKLKKGKKMNHSWADVVKSIVRSQLPLQCGLRLRVRWRSVQRSSASQLLSYLH